MNSVRSGLSRVSPPVIWIRYVDDTFVKILISELQAFFDHINSVDPNIKFTQEPMKDKKLPFLDAGVTVKDDGSLGVTVYRKPTHTDQYLLFESHHPLDHKLGVVRTLFHRANTVITDLEDREKEHNHLKGALRKCGYTDWVFHKALKPRPPRQPVDNPRPAGSSHVRVTLPYVEGVGEKVKRLLMKQGVQVSLRPPSSLRSMLIHPKDKISNERKSDVVYKVQCGVTGCDDFYIGETQQTLKARMKQHTKDTNSGVHQHMQEKHHRFDPIESVSVVDRESKWFERGVRESIYERMEKPAMNKKGGLRFTLSRTWDRAIQSATFHNKQSPSVVNASLGLTSSQVQSIGHSTDDSPMGRTETS